MRGARRKKGKRKKITENIISDVILGRGGVNEGKTSGVKMHMRKSKGVARSNQEDLHNHQGFSYKNLINGVKLMKYIQATDMLIVQEALHGLSANLSIIN